MRGMIRDRRRLSQRLGHVAGNDSQSIADIEAEIARSVGRVDRRRALRPPIAYPPDLPVVQQRDVLAKAIAEHQVVVVCGETGSGKTTQLPKICLELGRGIVGMIGHTQPRRVAARSVAARIADELGAGTGGVVGYKVRFGDKTSPGTLVKLMTDGVLLAELAHDRFLDAYDTLIIDEAHERSLNIDFLLGYLKQLLPKRPDLKVIITSATINPRQFSKHFSDAPIVEVSGRMFPVEVRYRPLHADDPEEDDLTQLDGVMRAVDEIISAGPGDALIFFPGERQIRDAADALQRHHGTRIAVLPLYARLSAAEQMKVFQPGGGRRRIVLATNVAETSLTVPGIRYVIDTGVARVSRYSPRSKVQRLPIEQISQASANQRKGRCGRVSEGVCIRLYGEDDFLQRPEFTEPEILRTNLASVILQMKALQLGDVNEFGFVEPPDYRQVRDGYQTLAELGAVDENNQLTPIGHDLAKTPVDPRIARMILEATRENCVAEALVIAAALSVQDPRERPMDQQQAADAAHAQWKDPQSDFIALLKLWHFYREQQEALSNSQIRKLCRTNFLSFIRMREWQDVHRQLHDLISEFRVRINDRPAKYDEIHRAILAGLLGNIGEKTDTHEYAGRGGGKFSIFPGSGLFQAKPKWLMSAELVQTTKLYARTNAMIKPEWIERLASHLVKRSYFEPHYVRGTASVAAYEKVSLYGLVIVPRRRVQYGPLEPKISRQLFIQHALVEEQFETDAPWRRHNAQLLRDAELMAAKLRRRNILTDAQSRFDFFHARLPAGIFSGQLFEKWRHDAERQDRRVLFMQRGDLLIPGLQPIASEQFPDRLRVGDLTVALMYVFDPADELDGVTAVLPLASLNAVDARPFEWLVPGLLLEKITELIRTLPKAIRVKLVPAPEFAARAAENLAFGEGELLPKLAWQLGKPPGEIIAPALFEPELIPKYLRMNFQVIDDAGKPLAIGRGLNELRGKLGVEIKRLITELPDHPFHRDGIKSWDFGDLPAEFEIRRPGIQFKGFPAIVDAGNDVSLRLLDTADAAASALRAGVRRLFLIDFRDDLSREVNALPDFADASLLFRRLGTAQELKAQVRTVIADRLLFGDGEQNAIRTHAAFQLRLQLAWDRLHPAAAETWRTVRQTLATFQAAWIDLSASRAASLDEAVTEMRADVDRLVPANFITATPWPWLKQLPRMLKAVSVRLKKAANAGVPRDRQQAANLAPYVLAYQKLAGDPAADRDEVERLRWMLEEYRVSLFAQELRTSITVSQRRLDEQIAKTRAALRCS